MSTQDLPSAAPPPAEAPASSAGADPAEGAPPDSAAPSVSLEQLAQVTVDLARRVEGSLASLCVRSGDASIALEWARGASPANPGPPPASPAGAGADATPAVASDRDAGPAGPDLFYVCSPMVGTFYHAPEPGAQPFVDVGDAVESGQQVGIIEAMKLMNRIDAQQAGRVVDVLVPDGTPVEYGERLIACSPPEG